MVQQVLSSHPCPSAEGFPRRVHYLVAALGFTLLAVYGSFVPLAYRAISLSEAVERFRAVPYLDLGVYSRADFVANLLLMIPVGYLWVGVVDTDRSRRWLALLCLPFIGAMLGVVIVGIEFGQLWFPHRTVSQNDMLAESIGSCVGIVGWFVLGRKINAWLRRFFSRQTAAHDWRLGLLRLYTVGLLVYMALPFDVAVSPEEIRRKIEAGRVSLIPLASISGVLEGLWQLGMDVVLYAPIGLLMRLRGVGVGDAGPMRSIPHAVGWVLVIAGGIELVQLFIFSRVVDTTDLVTAVVGGWFGAALAGPLSRYWRDQAGYGSGLSPALRLGVVMVGVGLYMLPLAASFWYPFDLDFDAARVRARLDHFWDYPFKLSYFGQEYVTAVNLARSVMLFVPVGMALRWGLGGAEQEGSGVAKWRVVLSVLGVVLMGVVIELGQVFTRSRIGDITDVGLYLIGAAVGWALAGRLFARDPVPQGSAASDPPAHNSQYGPLDYSMRGTRHRDR